MPSTATFECNEVVEYFSASKGAWILAKVVCVNKAGSYDLDCKPKVPADNIRKIVDASISRPPEGGSMVTTTHSAPVQLLRVEKRGDKWHYEVCAEGAKLLESHGARRIAVASICGLYRTGKSYILNLLLERVQRGLPLFQVGSTTRACTEGLWLWGSIDTQCESSPLLAFIDCEGFGSTDSDRTRDFNKTSGACEHQEFNIFSKRSSADPTIITKREGCNCQTNTASDPVAAAEEEEKTNDTKKVEEVKNDTPAANGMYAGEGVKFGAFRF